MRTFGLDLGEGRLWFWDKENGCEWKPSRLPPLKGGRKSADKNIRQLRQALEEADVVVTESSTIGTTGLIPEMVRDLPRELTQKLWVVSPRAIKNYRIQLKANGCTPPAGSKRKLHLWEASVHAEQPESRRKRWRYIAPEAKLSRRFRSVRPMDKWDYTTKRAKGLLALSEGYVPKCAPVKLSDNLRVVFATALFEKAGNRWRTGYERIVGLYDHGFPSYYRNAFTGKNGLVEQFRKYLGGPGYKDRNYQQFQRVRKQALKMAKCELKNLWRYMMGRLLANPENIKLLDTPDEYPNTDR